MSNIQRFSGPSAESNLGRSYTKTSSLLGLVTGFVAGVVMITCAQFAANAQMSVQVPSNVVGTGSNAWHYLITEGESYVSKTADPSTGFTQVYGNEGLATAAAAVSPTAALYPFISHVSGSA